LIDLHTHTTASDGRYTPRQLVARAAAAGVTVLSVTDHDTVSGCAEAAAACAESGVSFVAGIEMTAVLASADVHVLGYFLDVRAEPLLAFLARQRRSRIERVREMVARLKTFNIHLDADAILKPGMDDHSISAGRPWIARALVSEGYVASTSEAFARWLGRDRPAFVPRSGAAPQAVFEEIHAAGGVASLAHPGLYHHDEWIGGFVESGLDAIEAYHSRHDSSVTGMYLNLADRLGVVVTGGSDYHGDPSHGPSAPGSVSLPQLAFDRFTAYASRHATSRASDSPSSTSS
jgi:predicted metal-dependent phosphoesterase TrpH